MTTDSFEFTAKAKVGASAPETRGLEVISVWTDGLGITSEYEPGWKPAYRFKVGETYRISISHLGSSDNNLKSMHAKADDLLAMVMSVAPERLTGPLEDLVNWLEVRARDW